MIQIDIANIMNLPSAVEPCQPMCAQHCQILYLVLYWMVLKEVVKWALMKDTEVPSVKSEIIPIWV